MSNPVFLLLLAVRRLLRLHRLAADQARPHHSSIDILKGLRRDTTFGSQAPRCLLIFPLMKGGSMVALLFTCPTTKLKVQHWVDDDAGLSENEFVGVVCAACAKLHLINCRTGKLLGEK